MCFSIRPLSVTRVLAFLGTLRRVSSRPDFDVGPIQIAQLAHRLGLALRLFIGGRIRAADDFAENGLGFLTGGLGSPRGAMPADRLPPLAPLAGPIDHHVGHRVALLAACAEPRHGRIPDGLSRLQRPHRAQADLLPLFLWRWHDFASRLLAIRSS